MKIERPTLDIPPKFLKLYMSLAISNNDFMAIFKPMIGVDSCFLNGHYKGQHLVTVGKNPNDNIYSIAIAIVEAENKHTWSWFLETVVADLGPSPHSSRGWTFIYDKQMVCCLCMVTQTLLITIYCMILLCFLRMGWFQALMLSYQILNTTHV